MGIFYLFCGRNFRELSINFEIRGKFTKISSLKVLHLELDTPSFLIKNYYYKICVIIKINAAKYDVKFLVCVGYCKRKITYKWPKHDKAENAKKLKHTLSKS